MNNHIFVTEKLFKKCYPKSPNDKKKVFLTGMQSAVEHLETSYYISRVNKNTLLFEVMLENIISEINYCLANIPEKENPHAEKIIKKKTTEKIPKVAVVKKKIKTRAKTTFKINKKNPEKGNSDGK